MVLSFLLLMCTISLSPPTSAFYPVHAVFEGVVVKPMGKQFGSFWVFLSARASDGSDPLGSRRLRREGHDGSKGINPVAFCLPGTVPLAVDRWPDSLKLLVGPRGLL